MKQITFNGLETTMFFTNNATIENICIWLQDIILSDKIEGLNESFSCDVTIVNEREFIISGDEDLIEGKIIDVKPIF